MAQLSQLNIFLQESAGSADAKNVHQLSPAPVSEEPEESRGATFDRCEFSFRYSLACGPKTGPRQGNSDMEVVRILLLVVLSLSYFYNCYLGMEYTYMFPQTACVIFTAAFLTCFTGILLISALILYHIRLRQGKSVYYLNYHLTWNISTAYISIFFHFASGFFSLLEYQRRATDSSLPSETETASQGSDFRMQSGSSIQVISLPETPPPPPSIVRVRSQESRNSDIPKPTQIQKRRVTWAL
uniref:Transmembrane protein 225 n=1 Tax=Pipistrellus kuhlii TaxID=59472 RepID=A0A7J7UHH7_PIPKU|nr:transmembrane protein 225 [Pipistrellus kuhlii]